MKDVHRDPVEVGVAKPTNPDRVSRINIQKHARMTFHGRVLVVRRHATRPRVAAAEAAGVPTRTAL